MKIESTEFKKTVVFLFVFMIEEQPKRFVHPIKVTINCLNFLINIPLITVMTTEARTQRGASKETLHH